MNAVTSLFLIFIIKISTGFRVSSRIPISSLTRSVSNFPVRENDDFSSIAETQKEIDRKISDEMSSLQEEQQQDEPPNDYSVRKSLDNIFGSTVESEDSTKRKIETYELMKTLLEEVQSTRDVVKRSVDMHALNMERQESLKLEMAARKDLEKLEKTITNRLENYVNERVENAKNETIERMSKMLNARLGERRVREIQDEGETLNPIIMYETNTVPHGAVYVMLEFLLKSDSVVPSRRDFRKDRLCLEKALGTALSLSIPSVSVSDVALDEILVFSETESSSPLSFLEYSDLRGSEEIDEETDRKDVRIRFRFQINERGYPDLLDYVVSSTLCCDDLLRVWQQNHMNVCNERENILDQVKSLRMFGAPVVRKRVPSSVSPIISPDTTKMRLRGVASSKFSSDVSPSSNVVVESGETTEKSMEKAKVEHEETEKREEREETDATPSTTLPPLPSPSPSPEPEPNCKTGRRQSPIDIVNSNNAMSRFSFSSNVPNVEKVSSKQLPNLNVRYPALRDSFDIINTGHGVLMTYPSELNGTVTLTRHDKLENTFNDTTLSHHDREITYRLRQIHFHVPGEHRVDGLPVTDAEMHMVHELLSQDVDDDVQPLLIIAIPISQSVRASPFWSYIVNRLPILPPHVSHDDDDITSRTARAKVSLTVNLNIGQIFFGSAMASISPSHYYTYHGSLTTEPCPEVVQWFVMKDSVGISGLQLQALSVSIGQTNARETQNSKWKTTMKGLTVFTGGGGA